MKERRIVIGDVHGCYRTLVELIENKVKATAGDKLYFLGDLIDRGPRVRQTVDYVVDLCERGRAVVIRGNHEEMLLQSLTDAIAFSNWIYNGCESTLAGFGVQHPLDIPEKYLNFFQNLPYFVEFDDFILVHGDLDFDAENPFENKYWMVWGRSLCARPEKIGYRKVVVGHTPTPLPRIQKSLKEWKISLDGGCVYANNPFRPDLGYLCALELDTSTLHYVYNIDF